MTQSIKTYNITDGSIKSFNFDSNVTASLNAATNANTVAQSANNLAQSANTLVASQTLSLSNVAPTINVISITDSSYNVLDDTAANTTGAYLQITGSNFQSGVIVMVGSNTATSTSLVNSSVIRAQVGSISSGTYPVYVINTNGGTGIKINGLTTSSFPAWSTGATLSNQSANTAFGVNLSATSDSSITYANTSALPAGTTLSSNGYFYGTISVGSDTTYNFDVKATDAENQDATRTFSVTVTVTVAKLWIWGSNNQGVQDIKRSSPTQVGTGTNWSKISLSGYVGMAIKTDGTLWSWGQNSDGQLGQNNINYINSPTQVGALTNWSNVWEGGNGLDSIVLKTDGTLWGWGKNTGGELGQNDIVARSSPVQIGTSTNWSMVTIGQYLTHAIKSDGTLWTWGYNANGQLGLNDRVSRSSPVQVGALTNWSFVSNRMHGPLAKKTDGTLWTWGFNNNGQLGKNDTIARSSPVQIGTDTNWSLISSGHYFNGATKTDGTLWLWGRNSYGQGGNNTNTPRSSPTQVAGTTWLLLSSGKYHVVATKTNNTLWSWGYNTQGALGLNTQGGYRSSPTQVGAQTYWTKISAGTITTLAITNA